MNLLGNKNPQKKMNSDQVTTQLMSNNAEFTNSSALKIRLQTKETLDDLKRFLKGKQIVVKQDKESGKTWLEENDLGDPLVNDVGLQAIMARCTALFNSATVQGFYHEDVYDKHIFMLRRTLAYDIALNSTKWGIDESNMHLICNTVLDMAKCFLSRLIDNWERRTLMPTTRVDGQTSTSQSDAIYR